MVDVALVAERQRSRDGGAAPGAECEQEGVVAARLSRGQPDRALRRQDGGDGVAPERGARAGG